VSENRGVPPNEARADAQPLRNEPNEDPAAVLGVSADASDTEVRAAYLRKVVEHPPDRSPEQFERVRDAYEKLRDPYRRIEAALLSVDPEAPLARLLDTGANPRRFVGPEPWMRVLRSR